MTEREAELIELLHKEVKPALGCTEPIAVALAAAKAMEQIPGQKGSEVSDALIKNIDVAVSGNILKNGMGVGIPGTDKIGLHIASALGTVCGKSAYGLEVLKDLSGDDVLKANKIVADRKVCIRVAEDVPLLYVKVIVRCGADEAWAVIRDDHDRIVEVGLNGKVIGGSAASETRGCDCSKSTLDYNLTVKEIYSFAKNADFEDIRFILCERDLNLALAKAGLEGNYGLGVGKAIRENQYEIFGDDFMSFAMGMTAAASDARMAGCKLPAMSNSGSGNQGITVSMPVITYSIKYDVDDERLARALILSNLVAIHIKGYLGKLSALCSCVIASTGSACGLVFLKGGSYEQVCYAIKNMVANITGMVCDGAKVGCAMKVASGVSCAIQSGVLALRGVSAGSTDGIIDDDVEKTIRNLGTIGSAGMKYTDKLIQKIMVCK